MCKDIRNDRLVYNACRKLKYKPLRYGKLCRYLKFLYADPHKKHHAAKVGLHLYRGRYYVRILPCETLLLCVPAKQLVLSRGRRGCT